MLKKKKTKCNINKVEGLDKKCPKNIGNQSEIWTDQWVDYFSKLFLNSLSLINTVDNLNKDSKIHEKQIKSIKSSGFDLTTSPTMLLEMLLYQNQFCSVSNYSASIISALLIQSVMFLFWNFQTKLYSFC